MRVLISAYACEPNRGSEPGAGWHWTIAALRSHEVWVLTCERHRAKIKMELERQPLRGLHVVVVDLPRWTSRWTRGERALRAHYVLWQVIAARTARRLHAEQCFDIIHHVTWANVWAPALASAADAPFVLGPVGGGPTVPLRLFSALGAFGAAREVAVRIARLLSRVNPLVRYGWRRARIVIVQNEETLSVLPPRVRSRATIRPNSSVPANIAQEPRRLPDHPVAVCAGRLIAFKATALAVEALAALPDWTLVVAGSGPQENRLRALAKRLGVAGRINFKPWLSQDELWRTIAEATALVLPSLREDASLVVAEAQALGVPVVAFDQGGPAVMARFPHARFELVPRGNRRESVMGLAEALRRVEQEPWPPDAPRPDFGVEAIADFIDAVYRSAVVPEGALGSAGGTA